jgi:hypothetical protein
MQDTMPEVFYALPAGITMGNTLGALQVGTAIGAFLFGIVSLQLYYYWEHHGTDGPYAKAIVSRCSLDVTLFLLTFSFVGSYHLVRL